MGDSHKRPLHIPPWQIPYLEKHRIFELFHELARELVIQQPNDHVSFLKQILVNAARARDTARVIIIGSPKVNCFEVATGVAEITKQVVITENTVLSAIRQGQWSELSSEMKAQYIAVLVRKENVYNLGWILLDCIKTERDAKALIQKGILPTHVIHLISPFQPSLTELLYCQVSVHWPEHRRNIMGIRNVFKQVLKEIYLLDRSLEAVTIECANILNIKPSICAIKPRVIIIGPRGCGRKTQAQMLVEALNLVHVDFERLICEAWMSESEFGNKVRACKNDLCFHSEILVQIINKRILAEDCLDKGWVLTGFPYTENDLKHLDCVDTPPNRIIFLECDLAVCKQRLLSRRINCYTGSIHSVTEKNEQKEQNLEPHPKDNAELIDAELSYYCENYGHIRKYCGNTAYYVNGVQMERWVHENIMAIISRAPNPVPPRKGLSESVSQSLSSDSCCCTPIPSKVLDCFVTNV